MRDFDDLKCGTQGMNYTIPAVVDALMRHTRKVACKREITVLSMADQVSVQNAGREDNCHIMPKKQSLDRGRLVAR